MQKLALVLSTAALMLTGCVSTAKPTELPKGTYSFNVDQGCPENLQLKVGESITVQVYDNVTTGYTWSVVGAEKFDVKSAYISRLPTDPIIVGGGADKTFIFTAKAQGVDTIALHHGRGWEGQTPAQWSCKVSIN
jgi:predicted secreted protein